ncbi:hypothetical protein K432DRAFT_385101 [Lepidopterella palustris CBS 459.81]|uniref:Uncharacterized protein n=1 Tax=Lepidopterella palustris CBS 459.81 TaxID=1314670 RepID=A0A8E2JBV6_9PEZI|nr:hypothetical protein K432DRAFT_385101 [Lepidopterella palustris CBS 459.81]
MAQVMGGLTLTAPSSRHDIVSQLLDGYGSSFQDAGNISPFAVSPTVSPIREKQKSTIKELPPPPPKNDKPLPASSISAMFMQFQLRVDETGIRSSDTDPKTQEQPTTIISRSISRKKPLPLKLTVSNGSTAIPLAATTTISSTKTPSYQDRPLPGLPPPPPEKSRLRPAMGNKSSRQLDERDEKAQSPKGIFKRRPLPSSKSSGSKANLTLADTISSSNSRPKGQLNTKIKPTSAYESSPAATTSTTPSQPQTQPEDSTELSSESTVTNQTSQHRSSTPNSTVENTNPDTPPTPDLKPALLPSPSPLPEESPSKYGLRKTSTETTQPARISAKHFRGKSSTGFDIFKASSGIQNARAYLNTITPSPTPSPIATPIADALSHSQTHSRETSEEAESQARIHDDEAMKKRLSAASTLNAFRPAKTSTPEIKLVHMECYHQHARFHRSSNRNAPVPCMMCYKDDSEDRWSCSWCALRICTTCREGLERVPGRSVQRMLEMRGIVGGGFKGVVLDAEKMEQRGPGVVVWEA